MTKRHILKRVVTHIYVIEFQKRNLFHAHILFINDRRDDVKKKNVDHAIKIVLSSTFASLRHDEIFHERDRLYYTIKKQMIHENCVNTLNAICHDKNDKCSKSFFKTFMFTIKFESFF